MIAISLLIVISVFWAMNMGASGLAVSFAPSVGSGNVTRNKAVIMFTILVLLGALILGGRVARTLSGKIIDPELLTQPVVLIILFSACVSLFLANIIRVPQSTSIIIVGSFVGAGLYFGSLNVLTIRYLLAVWIGVSLLSYAVTYFLVGRVYPTRQSNFRLHEKLSSHQGRLRKWTLFTDYYSAFGIGTNNVANVVGPLIAANAVSPEAGFIVFSILFGLGGFALGRGVLKTVSEEIVPLGTVSASIVSLVVSSFIVGCSVFGLPAPYVQFSSMSIMAVYAVKEERGHSQVFRHPIARKILKVWLITPALSVAITYIMLTFLRIGK